MRRRDFLATSAAGAAGLVLPAWRASAKRPADPKTVLILGGTGFVGPAIVEAARARGHSITLFNRGRTNADLFPDVEKLRGDRDPDVAGGLDALRGRRWDAVIDVWPNDPRIVGATCELLRDAVDRYVFISSIAVYADYRQVGITENAPLRRSVRAADRGYGENKVLCEEAIATSFPDRYTIGRAPAILGPRKEADSLRYWVVSLDRGGAVIAPGTGQDPVQYIDARDLAAWLVDAAAATARPGVFNTIGPIRPITMAELLYGCKAVTASDARLQWVNEAFLREHRVRSWGDMPLWAPVSEDPGFTQISNTRAVAAGLTFRPLADTAAAELAWFNANFPSNYDFGENEGLSRARHATLLKAWREQTG